VKNINLILLSLVVSWLIFIPVTVSAKDFLVAIDTGHSRTTPGAVSARGVGEFFFNQRIAEAVHARITAQKCGIKTFLVKNLDGNMPLSERTQVAGKEKADLFISIHHDSVQPHLLSFWDFNGKKNHYCDLYKGYSLFYSEKNIDPYHSILMAIFVSSEMSKNQFTPTLHHAEYMKGENKALVDAEKGIYKYNDLVVLKNTTMPAVLFECGIIVNRDEELELGKSECQEKIIISITEAIKRYYKFIHHKPDAIINKQP
jgi:N-acetylmuramoyl-L-alanine amidase